MLREIVCRNSGCKSTEFAQRHGREGIKLMGQKFFDMHESSRLNMSFKCSGAFNIIYIMRTNGKDSRIWRESLTLGRQLATIDNDSKSSVSPNESESSVYP